MTTAAYVYLQEGGFVYSGGRDISGGSLDKSGEANDGYRLGSVRLSAKGKINRRPSKRWTSYGMNEPATAIVISNDVELTKEIELSSDGELRIEDLSCNSGFIWIVGSNTGSITFNDEKLHQNDSSNGFLIAMNDKLEISIFRFINSSLNSNIKQIAFDKFRKKKEAAFMLFRKGKEKAFSLFRMAMNLMLNPTFLKIAALGATFAYLKSQIDEFADAPFAGIARAGDIIVKKVTSMFSNLRAGLAKIPGIGRFFKEKPQKPPVKPTTTAGKVAQGTKNVAKQALKRIPLLGAVAEGAIDAGSNEKKFNKRYPANFLYGATQS